MSAVAYALVGNGKSVDVTEIERADADVVDVMFSWGEGAGRTVLAVKHLGASDSLVLGGGDGCDFIVPESVLGAAKVKVLERTDGKIVLSAPAGSTMKLDGWARSEASLELAKGHVAELAIGSFSLRFSVVAAAKPVGLALGKQSGGFLGSLAGSILGHAALVAAAAFIIAPLAASDAQLDESNKLQLASIALDANAQREFEQRIEKSPEPGAAANQPEKGSGNVGKEEATAKQGKLAFKGDNTKPVTYSREQAAQEAQEYGANTLLSRLLLSHPTGLSAFSNGNDDATARGNMFTGNIHDVMGSETQPGDDSDGPIGWKRMDNTIGPLGNCVSQPGRPCKGIGHDSDKPLGTHDLARFDMRPAVFSATEGGLGKDVIQRTIHQHWGQFRFCYQAAVQQNPSLAGSVRVNFVIARTGGVSMAMDAGSDIPDSGVKSCVAGVFRGMSFAAPNTGTVTVSYGFTFSPSNA